MADHARPLARRTLHDGRVVVDGWGAFTVTVEDDGATQTGLRRDGANTGLAFIRSSAWLDVEEFVAEYAPMNDDDEELDAPVVRMGVFNTASNFEYSLTELWVWGADKYSLELAGTAIIQIPTVGSWERGVRETTSRVVFFRNGIRAASVMLRVASDPTPGISHTAEFLGIRDANEAVYGNLTRTYSCRRVLALPLPMCAAESSDDVNELAILSTVRLDLGPTTTPVHALAAWMHAGSASPPRAAEWAIALKIAALAAGANGPLAPSTVLLAAMLRGACTPPSIPSNAYDARHCSDMGNTCRLPARLRRRCGGNSRAAACSTFQSWGEIQAAVTDKSAASSPILVECRKIMENYALVGIDASTGKSCEMHVALVPRSLIGGRTDDAGARIVYAHPGTTHIPSGGAFEEDVAVAMHTTSSKLSLASTQAGWQASCFTPGAWEQSAARQTTITTLYVPDLAYPDANSHASVAAVSVNSTDGRRRGAALTDFLAHPPRCSFATQAVAQAPRMIAVQEAKPESWGFRPPALSMPVSPLVAVRVPHYTGNALPIFGDPDDDGFEPALIAAGFTVQDITKFDAFIVALVTPDK